VAPTARASTRLVLLHGIDGLQKLSPEYTMLAEMVAGKGYVVIFVHYMERTDLDGQNLVQLEQAIKLMLINPARRPTAGWCATCSANGWRRPRTP